ncbi:MAG: sigma-70 family RNA polymerase sigma factor [Myxococcota bacterium]
MASGDNEFELVARWGQGDAEAGNELVRRHYASVFRFFELRLTHAAEDLTQRTFLACAEALERRTLHTSFRSYLFGIARNQMLMHLRKASRLDGLRRFDNDGERPSRKTSLTAVFARCEEQQMLLIALVELPPDLQIAMQLYYWDGLSTAEIAEVVAIPPSTVTTRLARARELIKGHLANMRLPPTLQASIAGDLAGWTGSLVHDGTRRPG